MTFVGWYKSQYKISPMPFAMLEMVEQCEVELSKGEKNECG
jgi:hypothetical protein